MKPDEFLKFADLMPDALLLLSSDGIILAANRRIDERVGLDRKNIIGQPLSKIVVNPPDELQAYLRMCCRSRDGVISLLRFTGRAAALKCDGARLSAATEGGSPLVILRIPHDDTTVARFVVLNEKIDQLAREVERRKRAENELREQRDLATFGRDIGIALAHAATLREMLQRCTDLLVRHLDGAFARIWTLEVSSNTLKLQASAGLYTHVDGEHSRIKVGQYKIGLIAEERKPHLTNSVIGDQRVHDQAWAKSEGMVAFAGYPLIVDDRTVGVMAMFARHPLSENTLKAMSSVSNSIALGIDRKRVEAALKRNARALQLADRRKDEFLAMLAHELRNPLAPIRSGLELLQLQSEDGETIALMQEHVQHMVRLIEDLLDVSHIMRGKVELRREPLLLDDVVARAAQTVQSLIDQHRHQLSVVTSDVPIWLYADPVRMTQVVSNLLSNAAKYTPDGGSIWLETACENNDAILRVRDNGMGISADFLPEVFELFAQADRSLDRAHGGLGIGLTLAQRLVALHGGSISAVSEGVGKGSEFAVRLPMSSAPRQIQQPTGKVMEHPTEKLRILVVDDSVGSAKILRRILTAIGDHTVELAHDGPGAVTTAESFHPDVIFLDIGLPGIDGFEVARQLRVKPEFTSTIMVALTGYGTEQDRLKSQEAGFDQHLIKPVGVEELKQVLATKSSKQVEG